MYAFGPPGWSHDGSTKTIKQMRDSLKKEKKKIQSLDGKTHKNLEQQQENTEKVFSEVG